MKNITPTLMKVKNKLFNFFIFLLLSFSFLPSAKAQQNLTLYNMHAIPQSMYVNPGIMPDSRINIGLPILSSVYFNKSNSGFKLTDLVTKGEHGATYLDINNMVSHLATNNYLSTSLQTDLLSFGFKSKKSYFSFNATQKFVWRLRYPKDFINFLWKGNGASLGETLHFNFGLDVSDYMEYGIGYAYEVDDKLSIGGRVKMYSGIVNVSTKTSDITLTTDPNTYDITATSNIEVNTSGFGDGAFKDFKAIDYFTKLHNRGFGLDLGGQYKLNDKITLSASLLDLGYIKWKYSPSNIVSHNPNASFTYQGIDINQFINDSTTIDKAVRYVFDSLGTSFRLDTLHHAYKTKIGSQIYLGGKYQINEDSYASLLLQGHFFDKKLHPAMALAYNWKLDRYLTGSINYAIYNRSFLNLGLGLSLNAGPIQLYAVSDNLLGILIYQNYTIKNGGTTRDITYPGNAKNANLRVGLNLTIGRKPLDKDKDGINDKKDACPDIAGLAEFSGCPDKDGDKIPDKDDKCPDVAGLKEFFGCPDKDGDKVIDSEDDCPDVAGLVEFKGCPDKDGDKIIDKNDECPDVIGLAEFKGCPDKDGDKIRDKDDDCPDVSGLEKFKGCPDSDNDGIKDSEDKCPTKVGPLSNQGCPESVLYMLDEDGKVIGFTTKGKDGYYHFDKVPEDGKFKFRLEGDGNETVDNIQVMIAGQVNKATRTKDGFFKFEKIVPDEVKLKEMNEVQVPIKLLKEEQAILKKAFDNLEFNNGKDIIRFESYASLDDLGKLMVKKPTWRIKLSGHTDNAGNPKANLLLSQKRAQAVKNFLIDRGIKDDRIIVEYFGQTKPVADNKTEAGRQKNRRVEMLIIE